MQPSHEHEVTELLLRLSQGDRSAENRLYEIVMPDLRRMAQHLMNGERREHTLQGTELVNRMYLRLTGAELSLRDRGHFFAIAARAMRRELIDYARGRTSFCLIPFEGLPERVLAASDQLELTVTIDELLDRMKESMPLECTIVELKVFFGLTDEESATALNLPLRTMQAKWQDARIWLFEQAEAQQWKPTKTAAKSTTT